MNDLQMTRDGDLRITDNDIAVTDSIEQGILIRLRWWFGEWRFGPDYGVKYFERVFVKNPNKTLIASDLQKQIMDVDGVLRVENIDIDMDYKTRSALIRYTVVTESLERYMREVRIWSTA